MRIPGRGAHPLAQLKTNDRCGERSSAPRRRFGDRLDCDVISDESAIAVRIINDSPAAGQTGDAREGSTDGIGAIIERDVKFVRTAPV